jgi:hypothetical protein
LGDFDVVCFQGWHLVHTIITMFFNICFVVIASVVALTLFEPRMCTSDRTARINSKGEVAFIINLVASSILFSLIPEGYDIILVLLLLVLSLWMWSVYNLEDCYYDKELDTYYKIVSTYYFWVNLMLFISFLLGGTGFNGGLIAYMVGLPFISNILKI